MLIDVHTDELPEVQQPTSPHDPGQRQQPSAVSFASELQQFDNTESDSTRLNCAKFYGRGRGRAKQQVSNELQPCGRAERSKRKPSRYDQ